VRNQKIGMTNTILQSKNVWRETSFKDSRKGKEWSIWEPCWVGAGPGDSSTPKNFILATLSTRANRMRRPIRRRPNNQGPPNV